MRRGDPSLGSKELDTAALQRAFKSAAGGDARALDDLLTRYGGLPGRPNAKLAAAFAAEVAAHPGSASARLLARLANDDADADTQRAFLPIAAAYGFCAYLTGDARHKSADVETAWIAIAQLAVDERLPVRLGTVDALVALCAHPGSADALIARGAQWLEEEEREARFGAAAAVLAVLGQASAWAALRDHEAALAYISHVIAMIADAPRAAERSEARRRALRMLPDALCAMVARLARVAGERAAEWLGHECEIASQPQVRDALSLVIVRLGKDSQGLGRATSEKLRKTLEASAAPLRDGVVIRPGTGRGRASRKIR